MGQYLSNPSQTMVLSRVRDNAQVTEMLTNALQYALQVNNSNYWILHSSVSQAIRRLCSENRLCLFQGAQPEDVI